MAGPKWIKPDVIKMMAAGMPIGEIRRRLGIAQQTIYYHIKKSGARYCCPNCRQPLPPSYRIV